MIPARAITNPSTRSLEMLAGPRGLFDQSLAPAGTNRVEKRRLEREAKEVAAKKEAEDIKVEIEKVSTIPEGAKMPKKPAEACELVVAAQRGFMKKFHGQVEEAALTTQLGWLRSQRGARPAGQRVRVQPALCGSSVRPGSAAALQPLPRLRSHYARHRQRVG